MHSFATMLRSWTDDLVVLTGDAPLPADGSRARADLGIVVRTAPPTRLEHEDASLVAVTLDDGSRIERTGFFLGVRQRQTALVRGLGLELRSDPKMEGGSVQTDELGRTSLPMLWAAGDLCTPTQQVSAAIAAGGGCGATMHARLPPVR